MGLSSPETQHKHDLETHMLPTPNHTQLGADAWVMSRKRTFPIPKELSRFQKKIHTYRAVILGMEKWRKTEKDNVFKLAYSRARPKKLLGWPTNIWGGKLMRCTSPLPEKPRDFSFCIRFVVEVIANLDGIYLQNWGPLSFILSFIKSILINLLHV